MKVSQIALGGLYQMKSGQVRRITMVSNYYGLVWWVEHDNEWNTGSCRLHSFASATFKRLNATA